MANTNIHGFKVDYDESSHTLNTAVHYLEDKLDKSEVEVYFDAARRDVVNHKSHLEVRDPETGHNHDLTLVYDESEGGYRLRKRLIY